MIGWVLIAAGFVGFLGQFVYFRRFALRIPDERLAQSTRTVMWGFLVSYAVMVLGGAIMGATGFWGTGPGGGAGVRPGGLPSPGMIGGGMALCVAGVAALVFACWTYRLLLKYTKAFEEAAVLAWEFAQQHLPPAPAMPA
ncbi:MAG: hypothetical protein V2A79_16010 [Planctomycetota bacterium]